MNQNGIIGHTRELNYLLLLNKIEHMPHSVLFTGQKGIGKRLIAERFLSSFLCRENESPCGSCNICRQIAAGTFPDLIILEKDEKGKIPVGNKEKLMPGSVRWLIEKLTKASTTGYYSVIIDGVDTISESGQNALLKTIEEPYSKTYFILIASNRTGILPTIISRCIEVPFQPLKNEEILSIIKNKGKYSSETGVNIAISGGSAYTALKLHDESVYNEIMNISVAISTFIKSGNNEMFKYTDVKAVQDSEFLLTVLINIYSFIVRNGFTNELSLFSEDVIVEHEDAVKIIKILLTLKMGLGNNLNVKNFLKGFIYSYNAIETTGFPEPDFSWLI